MLNGILDPNSLSGDTSEDITRRRKMAEALAMQGTDTSPVGHWTQALARALQGGVGGYQASRARKEQSEADAPGRAAIAAFIRGQGGAPSPSPVAPSQSMTTADAGGGAPRTAPFSGSQGDFVNSMMPHAQRVAQETGLDPRLVIAQSALETGWGRSAPGNNFFGIKSHGQPGGNTLATTEVVNGQPVKINDSFRTYAGMGESAAGYAEFLKANPRYREVLGAQGLDAQIAAMARSGYATDPAYGEKLRQIASGVQIPQGQPQQVANLDGLPPGPVASDAPPMAYAPQQQPMGGAAPPQAPFGNLNGAQSAMAAPPMPPPRPESIGGAPMPADMPAPNAAPAGPAPQQVARNLAPGIAQGQPDPRVAMLAAGLSGRTSPQLRQTLMQLYQMGDKPQFQFQAVGDNLYKIDPRRGTAEAMPGINAAKPSDVQKQFAQAKAEGFQGNLLDYQRVLAESRRAQTNVNIDQKTETVADAETAKALIKRNVAAMDAADKAQSAMGDINTMREISARVGSLGAAADVKRAIGPYAEALGINIENLSDIQAFESVIQRMAPTLRAEGSGSTSDIEFKGMLASLPRLSSNPQARTMILDTMEGNARYNIMRGDIALKVLTKEIKREDGEKQMRALGDPMQAFKEFKKANPDLFSGGATQPKPPEMSPRDRALEELRRRSGT